MKDKILIVGSTGMLGHMVYHYLKGTKKYDLYNSAYRQKLTEDTIICDVKDQQRLEILFSIVRPKVVINCIGALIKESVDKPSSAIYLNAYLPHLLKDLCNQCNAKLIHISSDCVFSGKRGGYEAEDFRDADDIYGRSKALGEVIDSNHVTLRTSIIGPELKHNGEGLMNWFLNQSGQIKGYKKAIWSGVTTLELAKAIESVIDNDLVGLFHVTNGTPISKYELLKLFLKYLDSNIVEIIPDTKVAINKSLVSSKKFDFCVPSYDLMLKELVKEYDFIRRAVRVK